MSNSWRLYFCVGWLLLLWNIQSTYSKPPERAFSDLKLINSCDFHSKRFQHGVDVLLSNRFRGQHSWIFPQGRGQVSVKSKAVSSLLSNFASGHRTSVPGHRSCAKDPGHKTSLKNWLEQSICASGVAWRTTGIFPSPCQHQKARLSMPNSLTSWCLSSLSVIDVKDGGYR